MQKYVNVESLHWKYHREGGDCLPCMYQCDDPPSSSVDLNFKLQLLDLQHSSVQWEKQISNIHIPV